MSCPYPSIRVTQASDAERRITLYIINVNAVRSPSIQFNTPIDVFRAWLSSTPHRAAAIRDPLSRQSIRLRYPTVGLPEVGRRSMELQGF